MDLTPLDLLMLRKRAIARWNEVDGKLPGQNDPITSEQRMAIAWLEACTEFLHARCDGPNVQVKLEDLDDGPLE